MALAFDPSGWVLVNEALAPERTTAADPDQSEKGRTRVAYIVSRFPKLTETFILYELLAIERLGVVVDLYPLLRQRESVIQPEARALMARAHYAPFLSLPIIRSQIHWLRRRPRAYLGALLALLRGNWGSRNLLLGGLAVFPKVAHAARQMDRDGVTHVHCHFATHPALAGFVIQRLTGIPFSFTAHGSDLHVDRHMLCAKVAEARRVVTISDYNRELILEECGRRSHDKVSVIHCGVDTEHFVPASPPTGTFRIMCIGTIHEVKGQAFLVEACRRLARTGMDFVCHFVGDGPDRQALTEQIAAAGLADRLILEGAMTRTQIAALIGRSHVLVAPSVPTRTGQREGIPVVLMEAMSSGIPVVASRLSGIPELVDDGRTGLLVQPGDAEGLTEALRRLADDPDLRTRLGEAGRARVRREFDVAVNAAALRRHFTGQAPSHSRPA